MGYEGFFAGAVNLDIFRRRVNGMHTEIVEVLLWLSSILAVILLQRVFDSSSDDRLRATAWRFLIFSNSDLLIMRSKLVAEIENGAYLKKVRALRTVKAIDLAIEMKNVLGRTG